MSSFSSPPTYAGGHELMNTPRPACAGSAENGRRPITFAGKTGDLRGEQTYYSTAR